MTVDTQHQTVHELLPWHVTDTLSPEERKLVETHLASCRVCRDELELIREERTAVREQADNMPPVPDMLPHALSRIDDWERARTTEPAGWLARLIDRAWNPPVPFARAVFAVQFAVILLVGSLWLFSGPPDARFTTLSGPGGISNGARLTVIFRPGTTEEAMRQTLLDLNVNIVSGPSALGVYVVALPVDESEAAEVDAAIEAFRANSSVIDFVERQP